GPKSTNTAPAGRAESPRTARHSEAKRRTWPRRLRVLIAADSLLVCEVRLSRPLPGRATSGAGLPHRRRHRGRRLLVSLSANETAAILDRQIAWHQCSCASLPCPLGDELLEITGESVPVWP